MSSRRSTLQSLIGVFSVSSLLGLSGCSAPHNQNTAANTKVEIIVENNSSERYQGDLVVLDQNKSEFIGRDHNTWNLNESSVYTAEIRADRINELSVKIFLDTDEFTQRFHHRFSAEGNPRQVQVTIQIVEGPDLRFGMKTGQTA